MASRLFALNMGVQNIFSTSGYNKVEPDLGTREQQ